MLFLLKKEVQMGLLTKEKQGEIALAILKGKLKKEKRLPDVQEIKRNIGNVSKETGFSKEELTEFILILLKEMTGELISEVEKIGETGKSK